MNRIVTIALIVFFSIKAIYAQVPSISSFSPQSGPIGTIVSIIGNNFDPDPAKNIVFMGAVRANVVAATINSLKIVVPTGTSSQPITVTANGLTAYSSRPFVTTFYVVGGFSSTSLKRYAFDLEVGVSDNDDGFAIAVRDLDDDGQPDIISCGNVNIIIAKNISQPRRPAVTLALKKPISQPSKLTVEDLNGDGKPDIVVANFIQKTISVLINTSNNGDIFFADAVIYAVGTNPYDVCVADFNADGRPDIAVTNSASSSVSVLINATPSAGNISFLPAEYFSTPGLPRHITTGDMDMDGKPDLVISCKTGYVAILRNLSTTNVVNFSAPFNIAIPSGLLESVSVADFDNDLKPDITVADFSANNMATIKNAGSVGNMFFSPMQEIGVKNSYGTYAADINGDGKLDIVATNQENNGLAVFLNESLSNTIAFGDKINFFDGAYPRDVVVADFDNDGRSDIITGNTLRNVSIFAGSTKIPSVINFPPPVELDIDGFNIFHPDISSNNDESPITYTSSNSNVAFINEQGEIVIKGPGTVIITASQAESGNFLAAEPVSQTFIFTQSEAITVAAIGTKLTCDNDFSLNATSTSPRPFFYRSSQSTVATVSSSGIIHIVGPGTVTILISQPGNEVLKDVAPVYLQFEVKLPVTPGVTIAANNNTNTVCVGSPVTFIATVTNGGANPTYRWLVNGSVTGSNSQQLTLNNIVATDAVRCEIISNAACQLSALSNIVNVNVQSYVTPSLSIQTGVGPFCVGSAVVFTAIPVNEGTGATYQWRVNDVSVGTTTQPTYTYKGLNNGDRVTCVIATGSQACSTVPTALSNELVVNMILPEQPHVEIMTPASRVYEGAQVTFTATTQNSVAAYQWRVNGLNSGTNTSTFTTTALKDGDQITCMVTAADACATQETSEAIVMEVLQFARVRIPNAFTPNGDGINDTWEIPELTFYTDCVVRIFNRNGALIYQSKGYAKSWDGTVKGAKVAAGTYYYIIKANASSGAQRSSYVAVVK